MQRVAFRKGFTLKFMQACIRFVIDKQTLKINLNIAILYSTLYLATGYHNPIILTFIYTFIKPHDLYYFFYKHSF